MARQVEEGERTLLPVWGCECVTEGGIFPRTNIACYSSSRALGNHLEEVGTVLAEAAALAQPLAGRSKDLRLLGRRKWRGKEPWEGAGLHPARTWWPGQVSE